MKRNTLLHDALWHYQRNLTMLRRENGKFLMRQEKRMRAKIRKTFMKQAEWVVSHLRALEIFRENSIHYDKNAIEDQVDGMLGDMPGRANIVDTIIVYSGVAMNKGGTSIVKNLALREFGISFSLRHPDAIKYFSAKQQLELSNYKGNIDSRTKSALKGIILESLETGRNYTVTAELIMAQAKAGVFSYARAEMIAVREAALAYEFGKKTPINEFLAKHPDREVKKTWNTSGDASVTPECEENEKESPIPYNETFPNDGAQDTAPRSGNPRCRCWTTYEIV